MIKIGNAQGGGNLVTHNPGNKGRQKYIIHYATYEKYLNAENSTGYGCAEYRGETGTDTAYYKFSAVCFVKMKQFGNH